MRIRGGLGELRGGGSGHRLAAGAAGRGERCGALHGGRAGLGRPAGAAEAVTGVLGDSTSCSSREWASWDARASCKQRRSVALGRGWRALPVDAGRRGGVACEKGGAWVSCGVVGAATGAAAGRRAWRALHGSAGRCVGDGRAWGRDRAGRGGPWGLQRQGVVWRGEGGRWGVRVWAAGGDRAWRRWGALPVCADGAGRRGGAAWVGCGGVSEGWSRGAATGPAAGGAGRGERGSAAWRTGGLGARGEGGGGLRGAAQRREACSEARAGFAGCRRGLRAASKHGEGGER